MLQIEPTLRWLALASLAGRATEMVGPCCVLVLSLSLEAAFWLTLMKATGQSDSQC